MEGIINILKPPGMTSHDVVNFVRRHFKVRKVGHGGTLDPAAAGVLPIFIGRATKAVEFFDGDDKEYFAEIFFGVTTDTADLEGRVLTAIKDVDINVDMLKEILVRYTGLIEQLPPMYSAVHYKGKRLYELARKGICVPRQPRQVKIKSIRLLRFNENTAHIKVICSRGTYIRTLCEDIGRDMGIGACLGALIRTRSGNFDIAASVTLEEITEHRGEKNGLLTPVDKALRGHMSAVNIVLGGKRSFGKGDKFAFKNVTQLKPGELVRAYDGGNFLGVAEVTFDSSVVVIVKSFIRADGK